MFCWLLVQEWNVAASPCKNNSNCICLEHELEADLINNSLPIWINDTFFSNSHNISRALYPSGVAPSKVIRVEIMLYNSSSNSKRKINYVWTKSFIYTILPRTMLNIVSLGTLYYTSAELQVSIREFCEDVPGETYLKNALFSVSYPHDYFVIASYLCYDCSIKQKTSCARDSSFRDVFQTMLTTASSILLLVLIHMYTTTYHHNV